MGYDVDLASFKDGFPKTMAVPVELQRFAAFLKKLPRGSLGYFDVASEPISDSWVGDDDATDAVRKHLGMFLELHDGSQLALWDHGGPSPAVVMVGSEGDLENVAPTFSDFLVALSKRDTGVADLDGDEDDDDSPSKRDALAKWLAKEKIKASSKTPKPPNFEKWFNATTKAAIKAAAAARKGGAKRKGTKPSKAPADLLARATRLLGRMTDDPELLSFCARLGFDLPSNRKPDELRDLASEKLGFTLEVNWPWDCGNTTLAKQFSKAKRTALEKNKTRMFIAVTVCGEGYSPWSNAVGRSRKYARFAGALPAAVSFDDTRPAALKKLAKRFERGADRGDSVPFYDAANKVWMLARFAPAPKQAGKSSEGRLLAIRTAYDP